MFMKPEKKSVSFSRVFYDASLKGIFSVVQDHLPTKCIMIMVRLSETTPLKIKSYVLQQSRSVLLYNS